MQGERQIRMLHELSARAADARSVEVALQIVAEVLSENALDVPFALIYRAEEGEGRAQLVAECGWADYDGPAKTAELALDAAPSAGWPLGQVLTHGEEVVVTELTAHFGPLPKGRWNASPERAIVLPLSRAGQSTPCAALVLGISPHRALDDRYLRFFSRDRGAGDDADQVARRPLHGRDPLVVLGIAPCRMCNGSCGNPEAQSRKPRPGACPAIASAVGRRERTAHVGSIRLCGERIDDEERAYDTHLFAPFRMTADRGPGSIQSATQATWPAFAIAPSCFRRARDRFVISEGEIVRKCCASSWDKLRSASTSWRLVTMLGMAAGQAAGAAEAQGNNPLNIDPRRSLAITDLDLLEGFPLERVMNQLADLSGVQGLTGIELFRQWWDTQNLGINAVFADAPHCDDETIAGVPSLNGYPYDCREAPHEGRQTQCNSFDDPDCAYRPIGLFNRFDLAAQDGSHCGEYRIIYAKETGVTAALDRNLVIFEAAVPNPTPQNGLDGCRPILERWAQLSQVNSVNARASLLEQMYFDGVGTAIPAIVQPAHYGDNAQGLGQIRTNQFAGFQTVSPKVWTLREFKLQSDCSGGGGSACRLLMVPGPAGVNAFGPLFNPSSTLPQKAAFDAFFPSQVTSLAAPSIAGIGMQVPASFDSGQSHSSGPSNEMNYPFHFGTGSSALRMAIDSQLATLGNGLSAENIVARAQAMSCAGCHKLSDNKDLGGGLVWPVSLSFVHVSERQTEVVGGSERYLISPALINAFLPHRKQLMEDFLTGAPLAPVPPGLPIGGRAVH